MGAILPIQGIPDNYGGKFDDYRLESWLFKIFPTQEAEVFTNPDP